MIWLFKVNEVFWNNKPEVNEHYTFDTDDINFDITKYHISLYLATSHYYLISESNDKEVYWIRSNAIDVLDGFIFVPESSEIYSVVRNYYITTMRNVKINNILE